MLNVERLFEVDDIKEWTAGTHSLEKGNFNEQLDPSSALGICAPGL